MKKIFPIQALSFLFLMILSVSCTKDSSVITTANSASIQEDTKMSKKLLNVLMYTKSSYDKHDAHDYSEGHILEFSTNWKLFKAVNTVKIESALAFMQQAMLTGDTTGQHLNLFTYILPNAAFMDTYPDSALIYGNQSSYNSFMAWFESTCVNWMNTHGCTKVVKNTYTDKYIMKLHCQPQ